MIKRLSCKKSFALPMLMLLVTLTSGCASVFMDQAQIPGTDKYILVGHDGAPNATMWIMEGKELHSVTVEQGGSQ